jgi:hypothetical protein
VDYELPEKLTVEPEIFSQLSVIRRSGHGFLRDNDEMNDYWTTLFDTGFFSPPIIHGFAVKRRACQF